jgi:hypothetical protein
MPAYAGAFLIKDALVKFGSTEYTNQCSTARLVPEVNTQTMRTLVPDGQVTDIDTPVWTLEIKGLQDHETGGLAAFLQANHGTTSSVTIAAAKGTGKRQATITVRLVPPPFGGETGEWSEMDLEFPCQGQPTFAAQA